MGDRIVNVYGLGFLLHERGEVDAEALFNGSILVDEVVTLAR